MSGLFAASILAVQKTLINPLWTAPRHCQTQQSNVMSKTHWLLQPCKYQPKLPFQSNQSPKSPHFRLHFSLQWPAVTSTDFRLRVRSSHKQHSSAICCHPPQKPFPLFGSILPQMPVRNLTLAGLDCCRQMRRLFPGFWQCSQQPVALGGRQ